MTETVKKEALPEGVIAIIPLRTPIEDQEGNAVKELVIKKPTTVDYVEIGDPYGFENGKVKSDPQACLRYLQSCTGIHEPFLKQVDPRDFMKAAGAINNFFAQA